MTLPSPSSPDTSSSRSRRRFRNSSRCRSSWVSTCTRDSARPAGCWRSIAAASRPLDRKVWLPMPALALWWTATTLTAQHVNTALFGMRGRYNGLAAMLSALALFLFLATTRTTAREIEQRLGAICVALTAASAYALVQAAGLDRVAMAGGPAAVRRWDIRSSSPPRSRWRCPSRSLSRWMGGRGPRAGRGAPCRSSRGSH